MERILTVLASSSASPAFIYGIFIYEIVWTGELLSKCPVCDSKLLYPAGIRRDKTKVNRCESCKVGFLNPMPTQSEIIRFYDSYYSRQDGFGYSSYICPGKTTPLDYIILDILKEKKVERGARLLDIGCAYGNRVMFFEKKGYHTSGIDLGVEAVEFGRSEYGLDLYASSLEDFSSKDEYDAIMMIDVIEHIEDPHLWAKKVSTLLKPNGLLILFTPNFDCYNIYGESWGGYNMSFEHLFFYNKKSIEKIFSLYGFRLEQDTGYRSIPAKYVEGCEEEEKTGIGRFSSLKKVVPNQIVDLALDSLNQIKRKDRIGNGSEYSSLIVVGRKNGG
jgi:SAM-dependent methyltransferase